MPAAYVLTVVTYLSGASWGPIVSFQEFSTIEACENHRIKVIQMALDLNKSNSLSGGIRPERIKASCGKK